MFWRIGTSLDLIQDMTAQLYRTNLGSYLETPDNYLSVTKRMMFVGEPNDDRFQGAGGHGQVSFCLPVLRNTRTGIEMSDDGAGCDDRREFYGRKEISEHQDPSDTCIRI